MDPFSAIIGTGLGVISSIFGGGGPSREEKQLTRDETDLMVNLTSMTNQRFAQQSQLLDQIHSQLSNPTFFEQPGMSAQEFAARQSQIIGSTSRATAAATQQALTVMSGRGGGASSSLMSGPEASVIGSIAASGALSAAEMENQLTGESYSVGREIGKERVAAEEQMAALEDPTKFAEAAAAMGKEASQSAKSTREAQNARSAQEWGGITSSINAGINALGEDFGGTQKAVRSAQSAQSAGQPIAGTPSYGQIQPSWSATAGTLADPYATTAQLE